MKGGCVHILKSLAVIFFSLDIQLEGKLYTLILALVDYPHSFWPYRCVRRSGRN